MKECRRGHQHDDVQCRTCQRKTKSLYQQRTHLKNRYGLSLERYYEMFAAQNGVCAICKNPGRPRKSEFLEPRLLDVDHDHVTGKVRGLLCNSCNRQLVATLERLGHLIEPAREYLRKHKD